MSNVTGFDNTTVNQGRWWGWVVLMRWAGAAVCWVRMFLVYFRMKWGPLEGSSLYSTESLPASMRNIDPVLRLILHTNRRRGAHFRAKLVGNIPLGSTLKFQFWKRQELAVETQGQGILKWCFHTWYFKFKFWNRDQSANEDLWSVYETCWS